MKRRGRELIWLILLVSLPSISWAAPTPPSITSSPSSDSINPSSLNIHGIRPGMSRQQIESITGPPFSTGNGTWYGIAESDTPKERVVYVDYSRQQIAVAVLGYDLQASDTLILSDLISPEEIRAKLGEPTYEAQEADGAPTRLRYEDLKLTVSWWDMHDNHDPNRKIFAIILEDEDPLPHP